MPDLKKIKEIFIIDAFPKNIYNEFKRQFSDAVPDFKCTPKEILKLSLINRYTTANKSYSRALLA